jgi:intermediate filament protein if
MNATTTFQRQARGPISITEIDKDGVYIVLENTSRSKDVNLTNWSIRRELDYIRTIEFKFPDGLVMRSNSMLKVWAGEAGRDDRAKGEIQNREISTWGISRSHAVTTVLSDDFSEKANHIQKTLYSNN